MENFGSAIFGLAKLKKKGHSRKDEEEKKKMRMMVCLVELFSQCTFMYKTTTSRIISFLALKHVRTQWITKWSTKRPATCLLLAEAETKFFEIFQIQRTERSNILFHFSTVYLKTTTLHVRTSLIFTFIS